MDAQLWLDQARNWLTEESFSRGAALAGAAGAAALAAGWRLLARRRAPPERTVVSVNAAKGETVSVRIGDGGMDE